MGDSEVQKLGAQLYFKLLNKRYLLCEDDLVLKYFDNDEIRAYVKNLADCSGVRIIKKEKYIHMLTNPTNCIFATSLSELKKNVKSYDSRIDLYLMGVIWMVLFSESDTEMSTNISWEDEGISYHQIEELVNKVLSHWKKIDDERNGKFSVEWSLAIKDMYRKWNLLSYRKTKHNKVVYSKNTKLGFIDCAMKELEKDKLIIIRKLGQTAIITPNVVFYERLQARFGNLGMYKDRYDKLKALIDDTKGYNEEGV